MKIFRLLFWGVFWAGLLAASQPAAFAAETASTPAATFPLTIADGVGRTVKLLAIPHRIISLSPGATDILVKIGAHAEIVGATRYCDIPAADETHVKRLGGVLDPDYEGMVALKPDLIIMPYLSDKSMQDKLSALGLTFVVLHPEGLTGVLADIRLVSQATGHDAQGETASRKIEAICGLTESRWKDVPIEKRPRVLIRMGGISPAPGSYVGDLLAAAGARNALPTGAQTWVTVSPENLLQLHPDLVVDIPLPGDSGASSESPQNLPGTIPEKTLTDGKAFYRPGPDLGMSLWQLARAIYPERFPESVPPTPNGPSAR